MAFQDWNVQGKQIVVYDVGCVGVFNRSENMCIRTAKKKDFTAYTTILLFTSVISFVNL